MNQTISFITSSSNRKGLQTGSGVPPRGHAKDCGLFRIGEPDHSDMVFWAALRLRLDAAVKATFDSF